MPPKTSKKKAGKAKNENPTENEESEKEKVKLLSKLVNELRSEKEVSELIRIENLEKLDEVNRLQRTLDSETSRHSEESALVLEEQQQDAAVLKHEISIVKLEIDKYLVELDGIEALSKENQALQQVYDDSMKAIEEESSRHTQEVNRINHERAEHRRQVERNFRKNLKEAERTSMAKAFDGLPTKSKKVLLANAKLKEELALQELGESHLRKFHDSQHEELNRLKEERRRMDASSIERCRKVVQIKRTMSNSEKYMLFLDQSIAELSAEKEQLLKEKAMENMSMDRLHDQRQQLNRALDEALKDVEKWKRRLGDAQSSQRDSLSTTQAVDLIGEWEEADREEKGIVSNNFTKLLRCKSDCLSRKSRHSRSRDSPCISTRSRQSKDKGFGGRELPLAVCTAQEKAMRLLSELPSQASYGSGN